MSTVSMEPETRSAAASRQAEALAQRLEQGASALAEFAATLSDAEWRTPFGSSDKRKIGVIVHHVASIYPLEIQLAQLLAAGKPVTGVTWDAVADVNAGHAADNENSATTKYRAGICKHDCSAKPLHRPHRPGKCVQRIVSRSRNKIQCGCDHFSGLPRGKK